MSKPCLRNCVIRALLAGNILLVAACTFVSRIIPTSMPTSTITSTATASVTPTPAQTLTLPPTNTLEPTNTPAELLATEMPFALPEVPIVYYYFVALQSQTYPAGSVVIFPDLLVLGPTLSDQARSPYTITNIRSALQAMLDDPRNVWESSKVGITRITFADGSANVVMDGEYFGVGDVVLIAARYQILLTVFAEAAVQTATITLNGGNIANLGVSLSLEAKPDDYAFTRAEIDAFLAKNAYPVAESNAP